MKKLTVYEGLNGQLYKTKKGCENANKKHLKESEKLAADALAAKALKKNEDEILSKLFAVKTADEFQTLFNEALVKLRGKHFKSANFTFRWSGEGVEYWSKRPIMQGHMSGTFEPKKGREYTSSNIYGLGTETGTGCFSPDKTAIEFRIFLDKYPNLEKACEEIKQEKLAANKDATAMNIYNQKISAHVYNDDEVCRISNEIRKLNDELFSTRALVEAKIKKENPAPEKENKLQEVKDKYKGFFDSNG